MEKEVKMKKKIVILLTAFTIALSSITLTASAGDVIIDGGGGGGTGSGTYADGWGSGTSGQAGEGVRVTVVNIKTKNQIGRTIDFTNINWDIRANNPSAYVTGEINISTIGKNKLFYMNGGKYNRQSGDYDYWYNPTIQLPSIMKSDVAEPNIENLKAYFANEFVLKEVASKTGVNYKTLINGKYVVLLEPVCYFSFSGQGYALTATEVAELNRLQTNAGVKTIRSVLLSVSHKNLPLSIFLDGAIGYPAYDDNHEVVFVDPLTSLDLNVWSGTTTSTVVDNDIIEYLGVGLVIFPPEIDDDDKPNTLTTTPDTLDDPNPSMASDYTYTCDTDVITSVMVSASSDITCDGPATVNFNILGNRYAVSGIVIPEGGQQRVWVKWHTPKIPQAIYIGVTTNSSAASAKGTIKASIINLVENTPPDPTALDIKPTGYSIPTDGLPGESNTSTVHSWSVWNCYKTYTLVDHYIIYDGTYGTTKRICVHNLCDYCSKYGDVPYEHYWVSMWTEQVDIEYHYYTEESSLSVTSNMTVQPDELVPTAELRWYAPTYEDAWMIGRICLSLDLA